MQNNNIIDNVYDTVNDQYKEISIFALSPQLHTLFKTSL